MRWSLIISLAAVLLASCAPAADDRGLDSPYPQVKLSAISEAARTDDRSAIKGLIEQLVSDDPAVRMAAITTLEQLTGQTRGYRYYDAPALRRQAIDRWVRAYEAGEFSHHAPTQTSATSADS